MQTNEIVLLRDRLRAARAKLLAAVDGLDARAWSWLPGDGRWSIGLTLAHVGSAQWDHLKVVQRLLDGRPIVVSEFDLDAWNAASVGKREGWSRGKILADLGAAEEKTLAILGGLDVSQLAVAGTHPALGTVTVGEVFRIIGLHDGLHRRDVLRLLREMNGP